MRDEYFRSPVFRSAPTSFPTCSSFAGRSPASHNRRSVSQSVSQSVRHIIDHWAPSIIESWMIHTIFEIDPFDIHFSPESLAGQCVYLEFTRCDVRVSLDLWKFFPARWIFVNCCFKSSSWKFDHDVKMDFCY